jgi:hypothetical protein
MGTVFRSIRHALRVLARAPGFSLTAIVTLAVGIGAATAMFTIVNSVLLRPLPFGDADRVLSVWTRYEASSGYEFTQFPLSGPEFTDYRAQTRALENVAWQNPHVMIELATVGADGAPQTWRLEAGSLTTLLRSGVTTEPFHVGDRVKIAGRRSRREEFAGLAANVLLSDQREAQMLTGAPPHFTGARMIRAADTAVGDVRAENRGIFRVWSVPSPNPMGAAVLQALPFTPAAVAARSSFDLLDNFATRCEPEGMPRLMFNPHPFEFVDHGATIALRAELYDQERTIHLDRT